MRITFNPLISRSAPLSRVRRVRARAADGSLWDGSEPTPGSEAPATISLSDESRLMSAGDPDPHGGPPRKAEWNLMVNLSKMGSR
jgi:hypothetical protein